MKGTIAQIEASYANLYGPGGNFHYEQYSRSTQLKALREFTKSLTSSRGKDAARIRGCIAGLNRCLEDGKEDARYGRRVGYRQEGGDDGYQYVVRVDGVPKWSGLTRSEAAYYKRQEIKRLKELDA